MNVFDSSGWLEYFADGANADFFAPAIEADALRAIALMHQGRVVELSDTLALGAARLSVDLKLPLADSIILHTARVHGATLWTQDAHFETVAGVAFARKGGPAA